MQHFNSKKILLIPPEINPFFKQNKDNFMPLGLLSLASVLRNNKYTPQIFKPRNRLVRVEDYKQTALDIARKKSFIVGFSTWCITYPASLLIAQELKKLSPKIPIVFGGPQASILAIETMINFPFVDFILCGEADLTFPLFVKEFSKPGKQLASIPGLVYRDSEGTIIQNKLNSVVQNLDEIPMPAFDLVPKNKKLVLDVGRGCPFHCTYCVTNNFFSKKYRVKSAQRIIDEMMFAYNKWNTKSFSFAHDMFTLNKKFILELCRQLIHLKNYKGIDFAWTCSARIDFINTEMLTAMKNAGCKSIFFGIETGSEKIQKSIHKNLTIEKAYELADCCRELNVKMHASFIIGFPDEKKGTWKKPCNAFINFLLKV